MFTEAAYGSQPSQLMIHTGSTGTLTFTVNGGGYAVSTPRQNFMQGEANSCVGAPNSTWMGNGASAESFDLLSESAAQIGIFSYWGSQSTSAIGLGTTYHLSTSGTYTFRNWGQ